MSSPPISARSTEAPPCPSSSRRWSAASWPLIYQPRRKFAFTSLNSLTDDSVFRRNKFAFGIDGRCNAGYGMWQPAYCSKVELTSANYEEARAAMMARFKRDGSPLTVRRNLLVVPPVLEGAARRLLINDRNAGGGNEWKCAHAQLAQSTHLQGSHRRRLCRERRTAALSMEIGATGE